ncbi:MAG: alanyl-tRNA editing protein [Planctomycetes bacterium]|nr:alanyl-tRNA editing protein [Planctomycetota bacterium]
MNATIRLYESEPFTFDLEAKLISRTSTGAGEEIILDRTVFFATSGGQPHDTGAIEGSQVVDVRKEGALIVHRLASPLPASVEPGNSVRGRVDAPRRLDYLRQHHGQHLLSSAFAKAGIQTTAVHFGEETSTLDLDRLVSPEKVEKIVELTNQIVLEDREVRVHTVSRDESVKYQLRREPGVEDEMLRLVEVDGFDTTPCSGTHPRRTGQVGPVAAIALEKIRGGTRVVFLCGERALRDANANGSAMRALARDLSVSTTGVGDAILKLKNGEKDLRRRARALAEALAEFRAAALVSASANSEVVASEVAEGGGADEAAMLAAGIVKGGRVAIIGAVADGRAHLVISAPANPRFDCAFALAAALPFIEGKGGGNAVLARGSGVRASGMAAAIRNAASAVIRK